MKLQPDSLPIEYVLTLLLRKRINDLTGGCCNLWETFYKSQNRRLKRYIAPLRLPPEQVEDVLQEVWRTTMARWDTFRNRGDAWYILAWSRRVAHNKAVDLRRRLNHRRAESLDSVRIEPVDTKAVRRTESAEKNEMVYSLLAILHREQSKNCWLVREHYLNGRSIKELAEETGLTEHAIHNRLHRAFNRLRNLAERIGTSCESMP